MDLNNIKRNNIDYLLTDILPNELSERFTYSFFYDFLIDESDKIKEMIHCLTATKAEPNGLFNAKEWASMPLKYPIMKELYTVREISLVQPLAAVEMLLFVEIYQKEILNLLSKNSCFSLRFHHRNSNLYYKNKNKSVVQYFSKEGKSMGREVIEQTGMFFNIRPFNSIAEFTSSEEWLVLNSKYKHFIRADYKACFDSIYTHTYTWLIGKDSIDTMKFKGNSNIYSVIDRVLQNINARRSNGIVVGPEFSRMIAELLLQAIDNSVYNRLINKKIHCGDDYNVYRYVDDIFIFSKSEELANIIVEEYSECARKYLLRLNEAKLYSNHVPFVLEGWLNETNIFINRMCEIIFTSRNRQETYLLGRKSLDYTETPKPALLRHHVIKYRSKAKQSIMNQFNELICKYEYKNKTIVAYFLSSILKHIDKNKNSNTLFEKNIKAKDVFSFIDLIFYAYSFFPNYWNTQKLLQIICYIRDEYDIFVEHEQLQNLFNKYSFILDKAKINDIVNLILFCYQAKIEIPYLQEEKLVQKMKEKDDPILWASYLIYSQYNDKYFYSIRNTIEEILLEKINSIMVDSAIYEYREFWWILVFNKSPLITKPTQNIIDKKIDSINIPPHNQCTCGSILVKLFKTYLKDNPKQFFKWDMDEIDFLRILTFKTKEKSIFKNYKENPISLAWESI